MSEHQYQLDTDFKSSNILFIRTAIHAQHIKFAAVLRVFDAHASAVDSYVVLCKTEHLEVLRDNWGSCNVPSSNTILSADRDCSEELEVIFEEQAFGSVLDMKVRSFSSCCRFFCTAP